MKQVGNIDRFFTPLRGFPLTHTSEYGTLNTEKYGLRWSILRLNTNWRDDMIDIPPTKLTIEFKRENNSSNKGFQWTAKCLETNTVACADTFPEASEAIVEMIRLHVQTKLDVSGHTIDYVGRELCSWITDSFLDEDEPACPTQRLIRGLNR